MIAIVNVSGGSPFGVQDYEVRLNSEVVAKFRHKRENGLGQCLLAAAKAVEKAKWDKAMDMYKELAGEWRANHEQGK